MATLLQIDFPSEGPWGPEMTAAYAELAAFLATYPELRWKIWTEHQPTSTAGGVYLFESVAAAERYLQEHTERLASFGITGVRAKIFDINEGLTEQTRGPIDI